jgi:hypothetical protein
LRLAAIGLGVLLAATVAFPSGGQNPGAVFLEIWPGTRPTALAGAFASTADDASATYYNDGGLPFVEGNYATLQHANWLPGLYPGMYYEFAGFTHEFKQKGTLGFNVIYLTTGKTDVVNSSGVPLGSYTTFDFATTAGYGFKIAPNLGAGVGLKFIYSFLVPDWVWQAMPELGIDAGGTGTTWAADFGLMYKPLHNLQLGASVANLGPNIAYTTSGASDPLPRTLRVGVLYSPVDNPTLRVSLLPEVSKILVGMFYQDPNNPQTFMQQLQYEWWEAWKSMGVEVCWADFVVARVGYFEDITGARGGIVFGDPTTGLSDEHVSITDAIFRSHSGKAFKSLGLTYGGGLKYKGFAFDASFDNLIYDFPTSNMKFSLSYNF